MLDVSGLGTPRERRNMELAFGIRMRVECSTCIRHTFGCVEV